VSFYKLKNQMWLEILALIIFAILYFILRYLIIRRPITYAEYEKCFFAFIALGFSYSLIFYF